jgi:hypothetical protein
MARIIHTKIHRNRYSIPVFTRMCPASIALYTCTSRLEALLMKVTCLFAVGLALWLPPAIIAQANRTIAGSIKNVTGDAVLRRGPDSMPVKEGTHIFPHDVLETAAAASLGIILQDGTRVAMGPNTRLEIDTYLYSPGEGKLECLLRLVRGAMVYVSGKMAQLSPGSTKVETPVGLVALRGTELAISLEDR